MLGILPTDEGELTGKAFTLPSAAGRHGGNQRSDMKTKQEAAVRRMGSPGSENWCAMLDGAEAILRDEGHAALTSRRVAAQIGVKQRLVYYYFRTMDELIVETFRRLAERDLARLRATCAAPHPVQEIWDVSIHTTDARLVSEFMALAHRIGGLKQEVVNFIQESRRIQIEAVTEALATSGKTSRISPAGLTLLATSTALAMAREGELGITTGHEDVRLLVTQFLTDVQQRQA